MFKVKVNDNVKEFNTLLEAKKNALLTFKKDNALKLVEVLDDEDNVLLTKSREEEPTQAQQENAQDSLIREKISQTWDFINSYESILVTLEDEELFNDAINSKLNDIIDDLHLHLGILESCLSDYDGEQPIEELRIR